MEDKNRNQLYGLPTKRQTTKKDNKARSWLFKVINKSIYPSPYI